MVLGIKFYSQSILSSRPHLELMTEIAGQTPQSNRQNLSAASSYIQPYIGNVTLESEHGKMGSGLPHLFTVEQSQAYPQRIH